MLKKLETFRKQNKNYLFQASVQYQQQEKTDQLFITVPQTKHAER